jgi:RNA polymerase sigma-70 factor (ECF subfamily)
VQRSLVERAKQGDGDAFDDLARLVGDSCMAIASGILRDHDMAADAVQAALISAWRELTTLRDADRFESWLHRIVVNACYAEARRHRRTRTDVHMVAMGGPVADELVSIHDRDQLERALRRLSVEHRAVLVFHHYLDLTVPEVAERLGIPAGTAKSRLHYATAALRASLEADARPSTVQLERPA